MARSTNPKRIVKGDYQNEYDYKKDTGEQTL
jgi:hypothetical protein